MNKAQLIEALADHYDGSKAEAAKALNAVVETITRQTAAGEKVSITGFGVFEKVSRAARMVRNPRTGERKRAKATAVPRFRAGSDLKAYVSGAKKLPKVGAKKTSPAVKTPAATATVKSAAKKSSPTKATANKSTARMRPPRLRQIHRRGQEVARSPQPRNHRAGLNAIIPARQTEPGCRRRLHAVVGRVRGRPSARRAYWHGHADRRPPSLRTAFRRGGLVDHDQLISAQAPLRVEQLRGGAPSPMK